MTIIKLEYNVPQLHYAVDFIYRHSRYIDRSPPKEAEERLKLFNSVKKSMENSAKSNARLIIKEHQTGKTYDDEWVHSLGTRGIMISFTEERYDGIIYISAEITVDPAIGFDNHYRESYTVFDDS